MATDRTYWKQVQVGELGSSRSVSNAAGVVAQESQRYLKVDLGASATTAGSDYVFPLARTDRLVKVMEVRILPSAALVASAANSVSIAYGYTNDNGGSLTTMGTINTNTAANGGTGNWAASQSIVVTANAAVSAQIPVGSMVEVTSTHTGAGVAIPAGTAFQMIWEEV